MKFPLNCQVVLEATSLLSQNIKYLKLCKLEVMLPICKVKIKKAWIIAPVKDSYPLENGVKVAPLQEFIDFLESLKP